MSFGTQPVELLRAGIAAVSFNERAYPVPGLPLVVVGEPLEEQKRENVCLVVLDLAAQARIGHAPEQVSELLFGEYRWWVQV